MAAELAPLRKELAKQKRMNEILKKNGGNTSVQNLFWTLVLLTEGARNAET